MVNFRTRKLFVSLAGTFILILISLSGKVAAQIDVNVDRQFTLSPQGVMEVIEKETLSNNFSDRYIPGGSERKYFFVVSAESPADREQVANEIYASLKLKLNGSPIDYQKIKEGDSYGISYILRQRLNPKSRQTVDISYTHPELGEKIGGLVDAYIPAFSEDFQFDLGNTKYTYQTKLRIPEASGSENIVSLEPISKYKEGNYDIYIFDQESLKGKFVWVQRGSRQIYRFSLVQELLPTSTNKNGDLNQYQMIIPRDMDEVNISQKIYLTEISPAPISVKKDVEGNIIGIFRVNASEKVQIKVNGYAVLERKPANVDLAKAGKLSDIFSDSNKSDQYSHYLKEAEYWEVDNSEIERKALQEVGSQEDVEVILSELYEYVVESIDYSQVKRFGLNERQGALKTLQGGAAVCMEYSDLYLTLLRNRRVPARAVFGYGYDSRLSSSDQEAHQWVQAYLPGYDNWISVDVTWGESGPKLIGGDLNHFYTHVAAVDPNTPSVLSRLAFGDTDTTLKSPEFHIEVLGELPFAEESPPDDVQLIPDLLEKYPNSAEEKEFYQAVLQNKYRTTISHLFSDPSSIDFQGWMMIGLTVVLLIIVVMILGKVVDFINNRAVSRKYKEKRTLV